MGRRQCVCFVQQSYVSESMSNMAIHISSLSPDASVTRVRQLSYLMTSPCSFKQPWHLKADRADTLPKLMAITSDPYLFSSAHVRVLCMFTVCCLKRNAHSCIWNFFVVCFLSYRIYGPKTQVHTKLLLTCTVTPLKAYVVKEASEKLCEHAPVALHYTICSNWWIVQENTTDTISSPQ